MCGWWVIFCSSLGGVGSALGVDTAVGEGADCVTAVTVDGLAGAACKGGVIGKLLEAVAAGGSGVAGAGVVSVDSGTAGSVVIS